MKKAGLSLLFCFATAIAEAQQPAKKLVKKEEFVDTDSGQHIFFEIPQTWKFENGTIESPSGAKLGEFTTGVLADYNYESGSEFIKGLKKGYADDVGNVVFVDSRVLVIGATTWTEGVRNVPLWDGKSNTSRWYTHDFFAILNKQKFLITFYNKQKQLPDEEAYKAILASIRLR